ncbi:MAG: hypothetical protein HRF43_06335 [Phycisphaerae bacterium]|jgi:hypothetical protein
MTFCNRIRDLPAWVVFNSGFSYSWCADSASTTAWRPLPAGFESPGVIWPKARFTGHEPFVASRARPSFDIQIREAAVPGRQVKQLGAQSDGRLPTKGATPVVQSRKPRLDFDDTMIHDDSRSETGG